MRGRWKHIALTLIFTLFSGCWDQIALVSTRPNDTNDTPPLLSHFYFGSEGSNASGDDDTTTFSGGAGSVVNLTQATLYIVAKVYQSVAPLSVQQTQQNSSFVIQAQYYTEVLADGSYSITVPYAPTDYEYVALYLTTSPPDADGNVEVVNFSDFKRPTALAGSPDTVVSLARDVFFERYLSFFKEANGVGVQVRRQGNKSFAAGAVLATSRSFCSDCAPDQVSVEYVNRRSHIFAQAAFTQRGVFYIGEKENEQTEWQNHRVEGVSSMNVRRIATARDETRFYALFNSLEQVVLMVRTDGARDFVRYNLFSGREIRDSALHVHDDGTVTVLGLESTGEMGSTVDLLEQVVKNGVMSSVRMVAGQLSSSSGGTTPGAPGNHSPKRMTVVGDDADYLALVVDDFGVTGYTPQGLAMPVASGSIKSLDSHETGNGLHLVLVGSGLAYLEFTRSGANIALKSSEVVPDSAHNFIDPDISASRGEVVICATDLSVYPVRAKAFVKRDVWSAVSQLSTNQSGTRNCAVSSSGQPL